MLKTEFYDRKKWATRDAARKAVARWIEIVYTRRRQHSALGMVSPSISKHGPLPKMIERKPCLTTK